MVLRIPLHMRPKHLILHERHIRRQHHERLGLEILILLRAIPLLPPPLLVQQQAEVIVADDRGGEGPGPFEAGAVRVAAAERVGTAQRDDLLVGEAHAAEDGAEVVPPLGAVGQAAVGRAEADVAVGAAGAPGDAGALHFLDGGHARKRPEVGVGDPGELGFHGLEELAGGFEAGVGAVVAFGGEAHGCAVGAACVGGGVVGA